MKNKKIKKEEEEEHNTELFFFRFRGNEIRIREVISLVGFFTDYIKEIQLFF
jgi:hypothetical protein